MTILRFKAGKEPKNSKTSSLFYPKYGFFKGYVNKTAVFLLKNLRE
jgi:hypothetical protein